VGESGFIFDVFATGKSTLLLENKHP